MINRYKTLSMSASEEEHSAVGELAERKRMKPAAVVRALFYKGLETYLHDGEIHSDQTDTELLAKLEEYLNTNGKIIVPVYKANEADIKAGKDKAKKRG